MSAAALYQLLTDFAPPPAIRREEPLPHFTPAPVQTEAAPDLPALLAEEYARGERETAERLDAAHREEIERLNERHRREIDEMFTRLGEAMAREVSERLETTVSRVTDLAADALARLVASVMEEDVRQRSCAALAATVAASLQNTEALRIDIRGPLPMFDAFRQALGETALELAYTEDDQPDLVVHLHETVLQTRLAEWSAAMAEALR